MVRWRDILDDTRLATAHPLLQAAVAHVAHYQIRNRGTVGGSIAHADPAAEMPGIAVTCDAEIAVVGKVRRARDHGRRFLSRRADDGARARRDHHRDPAAGLAGARGAGAFRNSARRRGDFALAAAALFYDQDASGKAPQRPCRHHRRRATGRCGCPRSRPCSTASAVDEATIGAAPRTVTSAAVDAQEDIHASARLSPRALAGTMVERALAKRGAPS